MQLGIPMEAVSKSALCAPPASLFHRRPSRRSAPITRRMSTVPDAQVEANVLKALAGAPQLADQPITTTTVYGVVTFSGQVRDEPTRRPRPSPPALPASRKSSTN